MTKRNPINKRTAERLIRAAYDFEALASRLSHDGAGFYANSVRDVSSQLGRIGRSMMNAAESKAV